MANGVVFQDRFYCIQSGGGCNRAYTIVAWNAIYYKCDYELSKEIELLGGNNESLKRFIGLVWLRQCIFQEQMPH